MGPAAGDGRRAAAALVRGGALVGRGFKERLAPFENSTLHTLTLVLPMSPVYV